MDRLITLGAVTLFLNPLWMAVVGATIVGGGYLMARLLGLL